jgi:uncharacterized protein YfaS (alpha-2-macroglobulin family)/protocatechuate 3,4-dioxygenase beta subunit
MKRSLLLSLALVCLAQTAAAQTAAATGALAGKVTRLRDGAPIAGASLTARPSEGGKAVKATSGTGGTYRFAKLADGAWRVTASAPGLLTETVERVEVRPGETATADLALRRGATLTGRVVDEAGQPIVGAEVEIAERKVRTDTAGRYRLSGVSPDQEWRVRAAATGYVQTWSDDVTVADESTVEVPEIRLATGATLAGRVVDSASGKPLAGVEVYAYGREIESGSSYGNGKTDAQGRYAIQGLRAGTHSLSAHREGYEYWSGGDLAAVKGETAAVPDVALALRPASFSLYSNQKVFAPGTRPKVYFNAFRTSSFTTTVRALEPGAAMSNSTSSGAVVGSVPRQTISYQRVLADVHGRGLTLPALPAGFYLVEAKADNGLGDTTWILMTDLALVGKETYGELVIWSVDLVTSKPRPGVEIRRAVTGLPIATTDADGLARVRKREGESFAPLLARDPASGAFALLNAASYWAPEKPETWRAYLETDRPIYRPAQTVFYKGTVRADRDGAYSIERPATARITIADPEGNELESRDVDVSATGTFSGSLELDGEAALGFYSIALRINESEPEGEGEGSDGGGDGVAVHGGSFRVEEYRKPEFRVDAALDRNWIVGGSGDLTATFDASYYFGGPVAGAKISYSVYASPFYPWSLFEDPAEACDDCWTGWDDSGYEEQGFGRLLSFGDATADANGRATVAIPTRRPRSAEDERYRVVARVSDPTGREVEDSASAIVSRASFALAVATERYVVAPDETLQIDVQARDFGGSAVSTPFTVRVLEEKWANGKSTTTLLHELQGATGTAGKGRVAVRPGRAGYLKLYALARDSTGRLTDESAWVWSAAEGWAIASAGRSTLEIVTDKRSYRPGETAKVLLNATTPNLDVLFTIEGESVREARRITLAGNSTLFDLPITAEAAPTMHLGATAVSGARLLQAERAVPVSPERRILTVVVTPEKEVYRPRERATFTVETRDASGRGVPAEVSLAVVDEAIYALSRELVPDIRAAFWGPRPNRVRTQHSFPYFYEGGADKFDASERRRVFKDTAHWEAHLRTDAGGRARVEFELPDNLTTWLATARAATVETAVGEDRSTTLARKDLMVRLAPPRFFVSGDEARLIAVVHNETDRPMRVETRAEFEGLAPLGPAETPFDLAPKSVGRLELPVRALAPGTARLVFDAVGGGLADGVELSVPVLPFGTTVVETDAGSTTTATTVALDLAPGADPASSRLAVHLFPSLAGGLLDALRWLDTYPYGCVEQTLNAFVPAAIVRHTFQTLGRDAVRGAFGEDDEAIEWLARDLPERIDDGLALLARWQQDDGGWGWWRHDPSHPFLTAYAVFGMALLEEADVEVDDEMLARGRAALQRLLPAASDADTRSWILYALARSGALGPSERETALALDTTPGDLSPYGRALLTSTLARVAPERAEQSGYALLRLAERGPGTGTTRWPVPTPRLYTWVGSDSEATAYAILAILETMGRGVERDALVENAMRYLTATRRGASWTSTKDTAAAVLAATAWLRERPAELAAPPAARVAFNDRPASEHPLGAAAAAATRVAAPPETIAPGTNRARIEPAARPPAGTGRRFRRRAAAPAATAASSPVYYSATLESVLPGVAPTPTSNGFTIERSYHRIRLERLGDEWKRVTEPFDPAAGALTAGERIEVRLRVTADRDWSFVVVEDPLPSGFEVEDAFGHSDSEWSDDSWSWWFARREVRDEKVAFFATQWGDEQTQEFSYTLRAEVPGTKHVPAASAALLYFPEIRGQSAGAELNVASRP